MGPLRCHHLTARGDGGTGDPETATSVLSVVGSSSRVRKLWRIEERPLQCNTIFPPLLDPRHSIEYYWDTRVIGDAETFKFDIFQQLVTVIM